ncbi:MAG: nucleotidyltransferase family protein [Acidobacteriota bacterium]
MGRQEILERLRQHEHALRSRGVVHIALFGSRARGDQRTDSDTDILVEFDPGARITVYDLVGVREEIGALIGGPVDVIDREGLKPRLIASVEQDALYAF